jgi:hypothetical protein
MIGAPLGAPAVGAWLHFSELKTDGASRLNYLGFYDTYICIFGS